MFDSQKELLDKIRLGESTFLDFAELLLTIYAAGE